MHTPAARRPAGHTARSICRVGKTRRVARVLGVFTVCVALAVTPRAYAAPADSVPVVVPAAAGGAAYAWGDRRFGQLGNGTGTSSSAPVAITGLGDGVTVVAAGSSHGLAIQNGAAFAWGRNQYGQLGNGTAADSSTPVAVSNLSSGVTAVAGGTEHSLAIRNGAVFAWGNNADGEVGHGKRTTTYVPEQVDDLSSDVTAIAAGAYHSLAIRNGAVYAWGTNEEGELGTGSKRRSIPKPVAVRHLSSGVTAIAAGHYHSLAIRNGAVYAWGSNQNSELGNGKRVKGSRLVAVTGLSSGVTAIAAGSDHNLAVKDGHVYTWGYNHFSLRPNGTRDRRSTFSEVDPTDLNTITAVAAGFGTCFALSSDGSLWVWGPNNQGELGLGNTIQWYSTPQHLLPPRGFVYTAITTTAEGDFALAILTAVPRASP